MNNLFSKCKLIIFDLDGTLYEDTDHFTYYANQLKQHVEVSKQPLFEEEYKKIESGDHIVTIGKVYDVVRDLVLEVNTQSEVKKAWTWSGKELAEMEWKKYYPHPLTYDFESMIAIGDGWWLPNVCAKHFGVIDTQSSYNRTKEYMVTPDFELTKIKRLREALVYLKNKRDIVLLTNSQADDVERLLLAIDLNNVFDRIITKAQKPKMTLNHFSSLLNEYNINPSNALSIGDNYLNEIAPAIQLSMKTIFIDFYNLSYEEYDGMKVKSISDTIDDMLRV